MEEELHKRVIGQEDAIRAVSQAIRRTRAGLKDPKRPERFVHLPRAFRRGQDRDRQDPGRVPLRGRGVADPARHVGVHGEAHGQPSGGFAPGYVGYEEGGQLTEAVRRKPFSVVLFDEIEKAHPDVFNALLQILEDGRLTDSQGRSVDFKNTVIIMTSNLGTADLRKASVGFARTSEAVTYEKMKEKVHDALKQHFRPEFLNRIDDVIVFHELTKDEVTEIIDLMIKRVRTSWKARVWLSSSPRPPSTTWSTRATTPPWGLGRCVELCSAWSRTRCRRRSSGRSSGPAKPSSSTWSRTPRQANHDRFPSYRRSATATGRDGRRRQRRVADTTAAGGTSPRCVRSQARSSQRAFGIVIGPRSW